MCNEHGSDCCDDVCTDWEDEPECTASEHDWTSEGVGGCDANPGVWSLGGTTYLTKVACVHCGIVRKTVEYGYQRNPDQCDERTYSYGGEP